MKRKSLTDALLLALEKSIDGYVRVEDFLYNTHIYARGYERNLKKPLLSQAVRRLREKGLVDFLDEEKLLLKLTDRGLDKAILLKLKSEEEKDWDGSWTIVSFDIPEKRRAIRDLLRFRLKEWGFVHWQKSLWASKKNCAVPLRKFIRDLGINSWVIVLESKNVVFNSKIIRSYEK